MYEDYGVDVFLSQCAQCSAHVEVMNQSGMDSAMYLHCTDCRFRVGISIYSSQYDAVCKEMESLGFEKDSDEAFDYSVARFEAMVKPCPCGGSFRYAAARRCLNCAHPIKAAKPGQFLWPFVPEEAAQELHDAAEDLIEKYVLEPEFVESD